MNLHIIDILIITGYLVLVVLGGLWLSRKARQDMDSYFLGGKTIPWYLLSISNGSSMFDVAGTMFGVYVFFTYGVKSLWFLWLWPAFNQIFMMVYLSKWVRRSNVLTGGEWIETRFGTGTGAELCRLSIVLFAIVSTVCMIAMAFVGIGKFAAVFFSWDVSPHVYAFIFVGVTTVYVIFGGMYSVVVTDILQYAMMTLVSICIAVVAMNKVSPELISSIVPEGWLDISFGRRLELDWSERLPALNDKIAQEGFVLFAYVVLMSLWQGVFKSMAGPGPNYDMQRVLATRSPRESSLMSGAASLVVMLPRYLLMSALAVLALGFFMPELKVMGGDVDFEQVMPEVIGNFLPVGISGLMVAGLLAAFMSTFDSTVNAGAAYIVNDIYKRYINPGASQAAYIRLSYIASILVVVMGIIFGLTSKTIVEIMMWLVAGLFGGFAAPNVIRWHWWRFNGYGYFAGMITGMVMALVYPRIFPSLSPIQAFPYLFGGSAVVSVIVSLLTKPNDDKILISFYTSVRPWGFWKPVREKVLSLDPDFKTGNCLTADAVSIAAGIIWQVTLAAMPVFLVLREWKGFWVSVFVCGVTSAVLKFAWYDKLESS
jgi:solute:Na+ symporter, SSS family